MGYLLLIIAILLEVSGTVSMKLSKGFTVLIPSICVFLFYTTSLTTLTFAIKKLDVSMAYAIWSGVGIVLIATIGWFRFRQTLDTPAIVGLGLIIVGVVIINAFSKSLPH